MASNLGNWAALMMSSLLSCILSLSDYWICNGIRYINRSIDVINWMSESIVAAFADAFVACRSVRRLFCHGGGDFFVFFRVVWQPKIRSIWLGTVSGARDVGVL